MRNRTGTIAIVFAIVAVIAVWWAVRQRDMSSPGFILAAYTIVAVVLALYTWSLSKRIGAGRR